MADFLTAKSPAAGLLPLEIGAHRAEEVDLGALTLVMPFRDAEKPLRSALKSAHGLAWPGPGRATGKEGCRAIWFGMDQLLLAGPAPAPDLAAYAACSDQSDAWTTVVLRGPAVHEVMARLSPVDMRPDVFKRGQTVRTQIGHMNGSVTRISADSLLLMVFRSMAGTLVHELREAMETVAARG